MKINTMLRIFAILFFGISVTALADKPLDVGIRAGVVTAGGEPANDIPGGGLFGRYWLNDQWAIGIGVDATSYDFEEPAKIVNIEPRGVIDAKADATAFTAWIERRYDRPNFQWQWFWAAGGGFNSVDVENISGPVSGGGRFNLKTEVDTELLLIGAAGLGRKINDRWNVEGTLRLEHHFADWRVTDRVSAREGTIDDYTAYGFYLGISHSF